jgi:hypothetical protein
MYYKEFRLFGKLFAISGFGIKFYTDTCGVGFRIHKDSIDIMDTKGSTKFYYYKRIFKYINNYIKRGRIQ